MDLDFDDENDILESISPGLVADRSRSPFPKRADRSPAIYNKAPVVQSSNSNV